MTGLLIATWAGLFVGLPLNGQAMDHAMHGMTMPAAPKRPVARHKPVPAIRTPVPARSSHPKAPVTPAAEPMQHDGHVMHDMPGMTMPDGGDAASAPVPKTDRTRLGTDLPAGDAPAPAARADHLADAIWGAEAMARSRDVDLVREHGGMRFSQILFNLAEYQVRRGQDGIRWDGEAWIGGDVDRLTVKSEGDVPLRGGDAAAEVQALYSHAVGPYWNVQAGVRYDVAPRPRRGYATLGIEGLAPYWFQVDGALFLSDRGDALGRIEATYDQRLTQNVVLQPRVEANLSAQNVAATGTGAGLTDVEVGLRLRYERRREAAPYIGVSWQREYGDTARFSRMRGDSTGGVGLVAGVRTWF